MANTLELHGSPKFAAVTASKKFLACVKQKEGAYYSSELEEIVGVARDSSGGSVVCFNSL